MSSSNAPSPLNFAINRVLRQLNVHEIGSEEYDKALDAYTRLHRIKEEESDSFSKDAMLLAGANLAGIFMILAFESRNVITSKALAMVMRTRV